jgi:hypothetical protein
VGEQAPRNWQHDRRIALATIALVAALLMLPALLAQPLAHDSFWINAVWTDQFAAELARGNPYPRWLPQSHGGLGSPVFYYYPPVSFYLSGIAQLLGLAPNQAVLAVFAIGFLLSGLGAFLWLERYPNPLVGSVLFMAAPYHGLDFVYRGAQAESLGIAILPFLAIGLRRIKEGRGWAPAALAYGALIATHLPLALLACLFFIAPYALVNRARLGQFALAATLGIGLAGVYLLPALALDPYRESARLYALPHLRPAYWTIWHGNLDDGVVRSMLFVAAMLGVAGSAAVAAGQRRLGIAAIAVVALAVGIVPGLWSLPLLDKVQFPYRALPLAELALAAAAAAAPGMRQALAVAVIPLALTAAVYRLPPHSSPLSSYLERHRDVAEHLPRGFLERSGDTPRPDEIARRIAGARAPLGWVLRRTFYFPAWTCAAPEPRTKLIMHRPDCTPRLERLPVENIGALLTLAALLALILSGWPARARKPLNLR